MRLMVCPRTKVAEYRDAPVTHCVSLVDPGEKDIIDPPPSTQSKLQLVFSDLDDLEMRIPKFSRYPAPKKEDVTALIDFGRSMSGLEDWGLLANCEAGISRSTSAAITILTAAGYRPQTAFGIVRKVCPEMLPNRRVLRIADEVLDTGGWLYHMAENHRRKMFIKAGYEDPTNVLYREAQERASVKKSFLQRIIDALPAGWRNLMGSGARQRAALNQQAQSAQFQPPAFYQGNGK